MNRRVNGQSVDEGLSLRGLTLARLAATPARRIVSSPIIRSPSLLPRPLPRPRRTLTPLLPPPLVLVLRILLVALVLWSEILAFRFAASWQCAFDDSPSVKGRVWDGTLATDTTSSSARRGWTNDGRWRAAALAGDKRGTPFHVLVVTDPQLLDMRSYPGRNWILRWLAVKMTDLYARKSWRAVTQYSRGRSGGGVDAVVWLGDLLDSGTEMVDRKECVARRRPRLPIRTYADISCVFGRPPRQAGTRPTSTASTSSSRSLAPRPRPSPRSRPPRPTRARTLSPQSRPSLSQATTTSASTARPPRSPATRASSSRTRSGRRGARGSGTGGVSSGSTRWPSSRTSFGRPTADSLRR